MPDRDTAGEIIHEDRLRAYLRCSEYYQFGGSYTPTLNHYVVKHSYQNLICNRLRKTTRTHAQVMSSSVMTAIRRFGAFDSLMEPQVQELIKKAIFLADEIDQILPPKKYLILTGPLPFRVKISRTTFELEVSAILRSLKKKTIHIVTFSPYATSHALQWDIPTHLKIQHLKNVVPFHQSRKQRAIAHIISIKEKGNSLHHSIIDDNQVNPRLLERITKIAQQMEEGYSRPLIPCPYKCEFKSKCYPYPVQSRGTST